MESAIISSLTFDSEQGLMAIDCTDQVFAYKLRRLWSLVLQDSFILEPTIDYCFNIENKNKSIWNLNCTFTSASGRYAFWRILNNHVPEVTDKLTGNLIKKKGISKHLKTALEALAFSNELKLSEKKADNPKGVLKHLFVKGA